MWSEFTWSEFTGILSTYKNTMNTSIGGVGFLLSPFPKSTLTNIVKVNEQYLYNLCNFQWKSHYNDYIMLQPLG